METKVVNLNLITSYPVKWDMYKVLRDFIQNFYDSVPKAEFSERFSYEYKEGCLELKCTNVSYNYEWLMHIGASSKTNSKDENFAGYFGEGFKIAALCAMRDYNLEVETASDNWRIKVVESDIVIDETMAKSLAYEIVTLEEESKDTTLTLKNFKEEDLELFLCALYSFYYEENPLFCDKIYSDKSCAIYHRSKIKKHHKYPHSYNNSGEGIVFASFQARGSLKENLIFCYNDYHDSDRDRDFFSDIDNIDIIVRCIERVNAEVAMELLIIFKRLWYTYPTEKYGYNSYYTVIKNLIFRMMYSKEVVSKFNEMYPKLLYANKLYKDNQRVINERKYSISWLYNNKDYTLVQDSFRLLNVQRLEDKCEEEGVLPKIQEPNQEQRKYISILENCIKEIYQGFFEVERMPIYYVIKNLEAGVSGYAVCKSVNIRKKNSYGYVYRKKIESICMKDVYLKKDNFATAITVLIHELCHVFGGDKSENFSYAMTEAFQIAIRNVDIVNKYKEAWEEL